MVHRNEWLAVVVAAVAVAAAVAVVAAAVAVAAGGVAVAVAAVRERCHCQTRHFPELPSALKITPYQKKNQIPKIPVSYLLIPLIPFPELQIQM